MPKVGAHVSAAGSLASSFDRALELGAESTQIFITPPQQWIQTQHSDEVITNYKKRAQETGTTPNFIHATYLLNMASDNPEHLQKSINWLIYSQQMAEKLGVKGTIFHIGSYKKKSRGGTLEQVVQAVKSVLTQTGQTDLILENSAGAGNLIGDQLSEIGEIVRQVNDPRIKVCLDTQHAFASGYDLRTEEGVAKWIGELDKEVETGKLVAIHANDSKTELGSKKDRHENIGKGLIGLEGFRLLINHPQLQDIPFILEIPGEDGKGPDKNNIEVLKSLIR